MTFDPNDPNKLDATGWGVKRPTGWGVVVFIAACAAVVAALVAVLGG